jgi:biopolymer transport protein ExbB
MGYEELRQLLIQGGLTTFAILFASVIALGVGIERVLVLWGVRAQTRALGETIARHLLRGDAASGRMAAERSQAFSADIFLSGFERAAKTTGPGLDAAVERERMQALLKLRSKLWILGTIGAASPFVGLFGTVVGILRSFRDLGLDVQGGGIGGPGTVMTGISEALVSTAAGIIVAVEAVVLYNYFQSRLARMSVELKLVADEFVELLREKAVNGVVVSAGTGTETPAAAPVPSPAPTGGV